MELDIADAIGKYGFPIVASFGMGAMVFYIWKWVTTEIKPALLAMLEELERKGFSHEWVNDQWINIKNG